ncbi:unnamed protein product [Coregonus sp. 'balchen']|nr:unnamed protein product [Coregonus sp. 'balchen']
MIKRTPTGGKTDKKRGDVIYERGVKGRRDEHNGGAGRDSGEPIAMALLGDTAEDVTERNGRTQRRNTTWRRVKKEGGGKQREGLSLARMPRSRPVSGAAPCGRLRGLSVGQVGVCRARGEVMESVRKAAEMVIEECQHQFRNRRWNCSTTPRGVNVFGRVMSQGTREAAFVHALSSAAVAVAVTRGCSRGELERCGCDRKVRGVSPEGFQWSGCSDNLSYGVAFSQTFVDETERAKGMSAGRPLMNVHNNEAGRKAILHNMQVECKCHGVSGSCELRTCWKVMPPFRRVGAVLKERFDGATEVRLSRIGSRTALLPRDPQVKPPAARDLVYLAASPDFCRLDPDNGIPGTAGRRCNGTSRLAPDGCELVCCGPGYRAGRAEVVQRCSCKFSWCCSVRCQQCKNTVMIHTCRV